MRNGIFSIAILTLLSACSVGTHNTSKGVCRGVERCQGGECRRLNEQLTQNHCDMVGGEFESANHKKGWFNL